MNTAAVFHRSTIEFCYALDNDTITVNIKTGKDVDRAFLVHGDSFIHELRREEQWTGDRLEMTLLAELENHLVWSARVKPKYKRLQYYFELMSGAEQYVVYENRICEAQKAQGVSPQYFKYAWLNSSDVIRPPKWVRDTVWYQIMPDRFCRDKNAPADSKFRKWGDMSNPEWNDVYGGTLRGIREKLDYIKSLGVSGIYLTPIFKSGSNHKYNTFDYWQVDPDFGTEQDLEELVRKAHSLGIRIMLDAVFNHSGHEFFAWKDVWEKGRESRYYDWFFINAEDFAQYKFATDDARYYTFSFWAPMPKLNTNNPEVVEYFKKLCLHWVRDLGIDGIRFDVGDEVSHTFIRSLNEAVKRENPEVFFLGEIWMDSISWLGGREYDSVMNYPLPVCVNDFWQNKSFDFCELIYSLNYCRTLYPEQVTRSLFNFLDTHDTPRVAEVCADNAELLQKIALVMSMPGTPCLYYGTEIAMKGRDTPYNRQCMPWDEIESGRHDLIKAEISKLVKLRNSREEMKSCDISFLPDESCARLIHYIKSSSVEIYLNASDKPVRVYPKGRVLYANKYSGSELEAGGILISEV